MTGVHTLTCKTYLRLALKNRVTYAHLHPNPNPNHAHNNVCFLFGIEKKTTSLYYLC